MANELGKEEVVAAVVLMVDSRNDRKWVTKYVEFRSFAFRNQSNAKKLQNRPEGPHSGIKLTGGKRIGPG